MLTAVDKDDAIDAERTGFTGLLGAVADRMSGSQLAAEGLRERKKRLMRKQISDTATGMFLDRGFDEVKVADVAAACGVSEKTIYNYFPTKEALLFDEEEQMAAEIVEALGPGGTLSPVQATVEMLDRNLVPIVEYLAEDGADQLTVRRFGELVDSTPSLRGAQRDMMERLVQVAAEAMAERAGLDPDDPEPQIAASAIIGLWRIEFLSLNRYADGTRPPVEIHALVTDDVARAARLIDTGLFSFSVAVQGTDSRAQVRQAADAANDARKQVAVALREAREAWKLVKDQLVAAHEEHERAHHPGRSGGRADQRDRMIAQREAQLARAMARRAVAQGQREAARDQAKGRGGVARGGASAGADAARTKAAAQREKAQRKADSKREAAQLAADAKRAAADAKRRTR